ncbi:unnamed protein product [Symbiodinium sp. CCMP2592]|nr:unnamed protein product [Symbiodinium sp. CCMP2592]
MAYCCGPPDGNAEHSHVDRPIAPAVQESDAEELVRGPQFVQALQTLDDSEGHATDVEAEDAKGPEPETSDPVPDHPEPEPASKDEPKDFDQNGDGTVNIVELVAFARQHKQLKQSFSFIKVVLLLVLVVVILFLLLTFCPSVVAIQLTKEMTTTGGALMPTGCSEGQGECKPIATGPSKRESKTLTSTMPDDAFEELKSVTLSLPHQNGEQVKVALDILSYERRMVPTSKCGSVVDLETIHGVLMIDDSEISASLDFVEKMNSRGFNIDDDGPLLAVDGARRLSVGSDIAGMFNFIADYNYTCESQAKPLQNLEPPFKFTIDSYQACESWTCFSQVFDDLNITGPQGKKVGLPGLTTDPYGTETFVRGRFIKAREEVYALSKEKIITIQTWPNYPMMSLLSVHDFEKKLLVQKQIFNNTQATHCSTRPSKDEEDMMTNMEDFVVSAVGTTSYKSEPGRTFNRYILYHREKVHQEEAYVEYWEDQATGMPHKYFMPNIDESPRAYFTSYENKVDEAEFEDLQRRIDVMDCHSPEIFTLIPPIMDDDEQTPATENVSTLEFYKALNQVCVSEACKMLFMDESYWNLVLETPLNASGTNSSDSSDLESDPAARLLAESQDGNDLEGLSLENDTARRLYSRIPRYSWGGYNVDYRKKKQVQKGFGTSKYGFDFNMEWGSFYSTSPTSRGLLVAQVASLEGSARGEANIGVGAAYVTIGCWGYAKGWTVAFISGNTYYDFEGEMCLKFGGGVNIIIGKMEVEIQGCVRVEKAKYAVEMQWTLRARFFNLGPDFEDENSHDDEIEVTGSAGFKAKVFWFFTVRWQVRLEVVPRKKLWNSDPEKLTGVDTANIGDLYVRGYVPLDVWWRCPDTRRRIDHSWGFRRRWGANGNRFVIYGDENTDETGMAVYECDW